MDLVLFMLFCFLLSLWVAYEKAKKAAGEAMKNEQVKAGAKAVGGAGLAWVLRKLSGK